MMEWINSINKTIKYLENNSIHSKEHLTKINNLGFLTTNFQYGLETKRNHLDIKSIHIEDRAYISGFIKNSMRDKFIKEIKSNLNMMAFFTIVTWIKSPIDIDLVLENKQATKIAQVYITPTEFNKLKTQAMIETLEDVSYIYCIDFKFNRKAHCSNGLFENVINALEKVDI